MGVEELITQAQIDNLIHLHDFINSKKSASRQLILEIQSAILDSGKLPLEGWKVLRKGLAELEELIPVIDLIIRLKTEAMTNS